MIDAIETLKPWGNLEEALERLDSVFLKVKLFRHLFDAML